MNTPTPGDLSARLERVADQISGSNGFLSPDARRSIPAELRSIVAALSALPEGGEPVAWCALKGDGSIAYFDGKPMVMPGKVGNEHHPVPLYTTPPPDAAVGVVDHDCRNPESPCFHLSHRESAAVGAQGERIRRVYLQDMEDTLRQLHAIVGLEQPDVDALIEKVRRLAAPAAGKGVDDAMVERAFNAWCDVAEVDEWCVRNSREAITAALEAALTRQPVAGDGMGAGEREELERLRSLVNTPELHDFTRGVVLEGAHQRERWGNDHDAGKEPQDWFWLIGYLAGKALRSHLDGSTDKALHHTITIAAACANWHGAILGTHNMRPGIDGEAALAAPAATPTDGGEG